MNSKKLKELILESFIINNDITQTLKSLVDSDVINVFFLKDKTNEEKSDIHFKILIISENFNSDILISKKDIRKFKIKKLKNI